MTPERFADIVEAYGAQPEQWPEAERAEAEAFADFWPDVAGPLLAEQAGLDRVLDLYRLPTPTAALQARLLVLKPRPADMRRWVAGLGVGLAAACAAGVIFGVQVSRAVSADTRTEAAIAAALGTETPTDAAALVREDG